MTTFSFNENIPAANNNPSADQPIMQTNNASTKSILAVDHLTFDSAGSGGAGASAGQHQQITYNDTHPPGAPVDPISIAYTDDSQTMAVVTSGVTPVAQNFFRNQNGIYPLSAIKAFGVFTTTNNPGPFPVAVTVDNGINVTTINKTASSTYVIDLTAGAVTGLVVGIIVTSSNGTEAPAWAYAANQITLTNFSIGSNGRKITFIVLQV